MIARKRRVNRNSYYIRIHNINPLSIINSIYKIRIRNLYETQPL